MNCHFCLAEIAQKEIENGTVVMLKAPNREEKTGIESPVGSLHIYAHTKHHGVQEEYDFQVVGAKVRRSK